MVSCFLEWQIDWCNENTSDRKKKVETHFFILASRLSLVTLVPEGGPVCITLSPQFEYFSEL